MQISRRAYAKLNLALAVGPPVSGGMHPISSWMHAIDLYDTVQVEWLGEHHPPTFEVTWAPDAPRPSPIDWPKEKDLAIRALRIMEQHEGRSLPISITIEKRIPVGGGLGGGSSDAAATLMAISELMSLTTKRDTLAKLSAVIGSDIAFFIDDVRESPPRPALVEGLGDRVERLPRREGEVILILPNFGCPTGPVYKAFDKLTGPDKPLRDAAVREAAAAATINSEHLFNDLLAPAESTQPALSPLRSAIESAAGLPVHMSGSGSTLFILPPPGANTADLATKIARERTDISVLATRLV